MVTSSYFSTVFGTKSKHILAKRSPKTTLLSSTEQENDCSRDELEEATLREELADFAQQSRLTSLQIPLAPEQQPVVETIIRSFDNLRFIMKTEAVIVVKSDAPSDETDVFVNVPQLATKGYDAFVNYLRHDRLDSMGGHRVRMLWDVAEVQSDTHHAFNAVSEGDGGVYSVSSSTGVKVALFKPTDEEAFVREGIQAGEGAIREEAAYVLDAAMGGFSGVPPTAVAQLHVANCKPKVSVKHPAKNNKSWFKLGAVQRFLQSTAGSMEGYGMPHSLEKAVKLATVDQVHRIGVLDIRTFNTDRHAGNILLVGDVAPYTLVPIDHGCILPSWDRLSEARFDWLGYPQANVPFSRTTREHIAKLDVSEDAHRLRRLGIGEECIATLRICTLVLQEATLAGMHPTVCDSRYTKPGHTLSWIGAFLQRDGCFEDPSQLENAVAKACSACGIPYSWTTNAHGEAKFEGILSRRPPGAFYACLRLVLHQYFH
ncbi:sporangia induced phosphatidyl inositol kinase [Achlya hypogyna]|uniref:Sporangia induced phosphatidyl inositol kinase n=1 Tax=Achlya hypogyna TaxID=1202772 RepID=A0A1V9YXF0_ACHHY|nr:sporangia induced phosphatidyl inositol kinase [Achlya hypogyna]